MRRASVEASSPMSADDKSIEPSPEADVHEIELMAELAEAEAAEAEAQAAAARARAAALRLRDEGIEPSSGKATGKRRVLLAVVIVVISGCLTASGLMVWQHQKAIAQKNRGAEYVAAAEKGVVALLSIDYNHAKDDVQRVIDASTGTFKADFARDSDSWVKTAEESKSVTQGSISAAALESMNGDNGVVLLAASSKVSNSNGAQQDPRAWRMSVTVTRDGDQLKMSNVEFVP